MTINWNFNPFPENHSIPSMNSDVFGPTWGREGLCPSAETIVNHLPQPFPPFYRGCYNFPPFQGKATLTLSQWGVSLDIKNNPAPVGRKRKTGSNDHPGVPPPLRCLLPAESLCCVEWAGLSCLHWAIELSGGSLCGVHIVEERLSGSAESRASVDSG